MNYGASIPSQQEQVPVSPIGQEILEKFEKNLNWAFSTSSVIEDRMHKLLNLRHPEAEEKQPTQMENDLFTSLANRVRAFEKLNEKLEGIVKHLDRIVP